MDGLPSPTYLLFSICISYTIGSNIAPKETYLVAIGKNLIKLTLWNFCIRVIHAEADKAQWVRSAKKIQNYTNEILQYQKTQLIKEYFQLFYLFF